MGLWGLVAALLPVAREVLGAPMSWPRSSQFLAPLGLLVSGVGLVATRVLVLRSLPAGLSALRVAAFAGLPLGVLVAAVPFTALAPLSPFTDVVSASGSLAFYLGVLVVGALLFGFLGGGKG